MFSFLQGHELIVKFPFKVQFRFKIMPTAEAKGTLKE